MLFAAVLIHEIGHALASRTFDFRLDEFAVWPFHFRRVQGGWHLVRLSTFGGRRLGLVGSFPLSGGRLRTRLFWIAASGPLASIMIGGIAALFAGRLERIFAQGRGRSTQNAARSPGTQTGRAQWKSID